MGNKRPDFKEWIEKRYKKIMEEKNALQQEQQERAKIERLDAYEELVKGRTRPSTESHHELISEQRGNVYDFETRK
jgi:hypothetical protein